MVKRVFAAALIVAIAGIGSAVAGPHGGRGHGGDRMKMGRALEQLDLSDAQKEQIQALMNREREASQGLRDQLRAKAREYRELREADDPRADTVKAELDALREQLKARHEALRVEMDKILTPEQRQKLEEWKASHPRRRRD